MRPNNRPSRWRKFVFFYGIILTLSFASVSIFQPDFLTLIGLKVYDTMVRALPQSGKNNQPVIIDVDEASLAEFGQWPWPRYRTALLLERLNSMGASAIGLDMIFAEEDRTSLEVLQREMLRDLNIDLSFDMPEVSNNDRILAASLKKGPLVLGYKFFFNKEKSDQPPLHPLNLIVRESSASSSVLSLHDAVGVMGNIAELSQAVKSSGFLNYPADDDGVLRRVPLLISYQDRVYPSFALAAVMTALKAKHIYVNLEGNKVEFVELKGRKIPLHGKGNLLLNYQGAKKFFEYIPATDILNNRVAKERIENKIVIVGTSAAGLHDNHSTPLGPLYPGVEVHATIVENIINSHFLTRPLWVRGAEFVSIVVLGALSTLFLAGASPLVSIAFFLLACIGSWYTSYLLLVKEGIFLNPLYAILMVIINFVFLSLLKYWREERRVKRRTKDLLLAQDTTLLSMAALAETRDNETGGHIMRTQHYVRALAEQLASHPRFADELDSETILLLYRSSPLHDIGKVGVADSILLNPGKLTFNEFDAMKEHCLLGYEALVKAEARLKDKGANSYLRLGREIAYTHHEKWDGTGYPRGLRGTEIPMAGRLMALADVYDALISKRRYKPAFTHQVAVSILRRGRGTHFDPDVVDAFLEQSEDFQEIARRFSDDQEPYEYEYGPYVT